MLVRLDRLARRAREDRTSHGVVILTQARESKDTFGVGDGDRGRLALVQR